MWLLYERNPLKQFQSIIRKKPEDRNIPGRWINAETAFRVMAQVIDIPQ